MEERYPAVHLFEMKLHVFVSDKRNPVISGSALSGS